MIKFYYGNNIPTGAVESDSLYFVAGKGLYKGNTLIANATDMIEIQNMIDDTVSDAIGGLGKAIVFLGHSSTPLTDGGIESPTISGEVRNISDIAAGSVVIYDSKEFILTIDGTWELFGDEGDYATQASLNALQESIEKGEIVTGKADALNLGQAVGNTNNPVYFKADGTPEAIAYTIDASVPGDAKFTDTITTVKKVEGDGNAITALTADANGQLTIQKGVTFASLSEVQGFLSWNPIQ